MSEELPSTPDITIIDVTSAATINSQNHLASAEKIYLENVYGFLLLLLVKFFPH